MTTATPAGTGTTPVPADSLTAPYAPFVDACERNHINRTMAYRLQAEGLLETFHIGRRVFVMIASLEALPEKLAVRQRSLRPQ